jgi:hypothetical protein
MMLANMFLLKIYDVSLLGLLVVFAQIGIPMALYEVQARSKQRKKVRR